jgi:hypothetical protein
MSRADLRKPGTEQRFHCTCIPEIMATVAAAAEARAACPITVLHGEHPAGSHLDFDADDNATLTERDPKPEAPPPLPAPCARADCTWFGKAHPGTCNPKPAPIAARPPARDPSVEWWERVKSVPETDRSLVDRLADLSDGEIMGNAKLDCKGGRCGHQPAMCRDIAARAALARVRPGERVEQAVAAVVRAQERKERVHANLRAVLAADEAAGIALDRAQKHLNAVLTGGEA